MFSTKVSVQRTLHDARVTLATGAERAYIRSWANQFPTKANLKVADILEYGDHALAKWDYYSKAGRCPVDWNEVPMRIQMEPDCELGALFNLFCEATPEFAVLAFAFIRRTWANNLAIDFIATNPLLETEEPRRVKGVGTSLLFALCEVAYRLKAPFVWGEATVSSRKFYEERFGVVVDDLFRINREQYVAVLKKAGILVSNEPLD